MVLHGPGHAVGHGWHVPGPDEHVATIRARGVVAVEHIRGHDERRAMFDEESEVAVVSTGIVGQRQWRAPTQTGLDTYGVRTTLMQPSSLSRNV